MDVGNESGGGVGYGQSGGGGGTLDPEFDGVMFSGDSLCELGSVNAGQSVSWTPCGMQPWNVYVGQGGLMIKITTTDPELSIVFTG